MLYTQVSSNCTLALTALNKDGFATGDVAFMSTGFLKFGRYKVALIEACLQYGVDLVVSDLDTGDQNVSDMFSPGHSKPAWTAHTWSSCGGPVHVLICSLAAKPFQVF